MPVAAFAVSRMTDQKSSFSQATAEIEDLKAFGYKGALLDFAKAKAAGRGAERLKQELVKIDTEEAKANASAKAQIELDKAPAKPEGTMPNPTGKSGGDRRKTERAQTEWLAKQEAYDKFKANELPLLIKAEAKRLKDIYDPKRAALKQDKDANFVGPEFEKYKKFASEAGFHEDAEWALRTADGDIDRAKILFDACKDNAGLKQFGEWASKNGFAGQKLGAVLKAAADFNLDPSKAQEVAPYLVDCPDPATRQWLGSRAAAKTAEELKFEVVLLKLHTAKTLNIATAAIDAAPGQTVLAKYNKLLAKPDLGVELLRLIRDSSIQSPVVAKIVDVYGERGNLESFLKAANPLPTGYASLADVCALVKTDPHGKKGSDIDFVKFAILEAGPPRNVGKPYIEHLLTRLGEGRTRAEIGDNIGYLEWLLVSDRPLGTIVSTNTPFKSGGPNAWTGVFKLTVDGKPIEVHNHFVQGGAQYSLHVKFGAGSFNRGPELNPKTDASVYGKISKACLDAYTAWVNGRWAVYTIPKS
jgi:hypothetical protein